MTTSFNNMITEAGHLSETGEAVFACCGIENGLSSFLNEFETLTPQQLTVVGSVLMKELSEFISAEFAELHQEQLAKEALWKMTDEEFESFLKTKYGELEGEALLKPNPMTTNEFERFAPIFAKRVKAAMKEAEKDMAKITQRFTFSPKKDLY